MENISLGNTFYWFGYKNATHPILFIIVPLIVVAFVLSGLIFMDFEVIIIIFLFFSFNLKNYGSLKILRQITNNCSSERNLELILELIR